MYQSPFNVSQSKHYVPETRTNSFWLGRTQQPSISYAVQYGTVYNPSVPQSVCENGPCNVPIVTGVCPIGPMASGPFSSKDR